MHRVIDTMNVIGSRPDGWWRDRDGAIERFVGQLDRWAGEGEERVTAVLERPLRRRLEAERVGIVWAPRPGPDSADREIVRLLGDWLLEDEVIVVTSDRDLAERARSLGAEIESAASFRAHLR